MPARAQATLLLPAHPWRLRAVSRLCAEALAGVATAAGECSELMLTTAKHFCRAFRQEAVLEFFQHLYTGKVSDALAMLRQDWAGLVQRFFLHVRLEQVVHAQSPMHACAWFDIAFAASLC